MMELEGLSSYVPVLILGYSLGVASKGFLFPWPVVLVVGVFLGIASTFGILAFLWYRMTRYGPDNESEGNAHSNKVQRGKKNLESGEELRKGTKQGPSLPHAMTTHGCFQGLVYTVAESAWGANECILDWPPSAKVFKSWNAEIDLGTLVLNPLDPDGEPLGIPLAQCRIHIVRDGLEGRSDFLRRAPILIKHKYHAIMDGESGLYLFANSPASKMCWVSALRFWSADDASEYREVQEKYREYCQEMQSSSDTHIRRDVPPPGRRSWKNIGMKSFRARGREENQKGLQNIESLIDREWMGSPEKKKNLASKTNSDTSIEQEISTQENREESGPPITWLHDLPGLCSPDAFFNDLLLRCSFDLVRNTHFAQGIADRIQLQLDRIHKPDYVQSLSIIQVDAGRTSPRISNLYSLPPTFPDTKMPQIAFDMKYEGSFSITIELKVDLRDSKGWGTLDKALDMIEGSRPRTLQEGSEEIDLLHTLSGVHEEEIDVAEDKESSTRTNLECLRKEAAQRLRKFADSTASRLASIPLRVKLTFSALEGPMCAWVMPPPSDRLFWSFLKPPKISISAKPQFGERVFKYAYHASRASAWIEARMKLSFQKNLVFPSGGDFRIPGLLSVENPIMSGTGTVSDNEDIVPEEIARSEPSSSKPFFDMRFRK